MVCIAYCCFRRRTKSYYLESSPKDRPRDSRRATIEYYTAPASSFPPNYTVPMQVQPSVFKLNKQTASEAYPSAGTDLSDGSFEGQILHVTQAYNRAAIEPIAEDSDDQLSTSSSLFGDSSHEGEKTRSMPRKTKLSKRLSLPVGKAKSAELVHHSPEHFLRKKKENNMEPEITTLEFSLFFDTASRELHITVLQVTGIPTPDESFLRLPNCSVKMRILPEMLSWQWSRKVARTNNPTFNETFIVPGFVHNKLRECTVHFVVLDFDHVQDNVYVIGEVFMPLSELRANKLEKHIKEVNPLSF